MEIFFIAGFIGGVLRGIVGLIEYSTLYKDVKIRPWYFVGMVKVMAQNEDPGPINLGNPDEFTIQELAEKVVELTASNSKIIHEELPNDDPKRRKPDISKAKKIVDWQPKIKLEEGLKKTVGYFRN